MKRRLLVLALACGGVQGQQIYDLLLKNGRVIDAANRRDARLDIAIDGNKIARVAPDLPAAAGRVVVDVGAYIVSPGLIDINAHFDLARGGVRPDYHTLPNGVTTAVDAGDETCATLADFKKRVIDRARTRILAFVSGSGEGCDQDVVVNRGGTPAMAPIEALSRKGASQLRPGDIVTGLYGSPMPAEEVGQARRRGILLECGAGQLRIGAAQVALKDGLPPDIISSGLDAANAVLPGDNLLTAMSEFLNLGMTPQQILERVTANAARAIRRPELGAFNEGGVADVAILEIQDGKFGLLDSGGRRLDAARRFRCVLTVRNGRIVWDTGGLSMPDSSKAGPYSNFK